MLSQNEIWEGIVHKWSSATEVLAFLATYVESEHYHSLSNHDQLEFDTFRRLVYDSLRNEEPSMLLYNYLAFRLGDYGWKLED